MDDKPYDVELEVQRANIALLRSKKILQSWLPPRREGEDESQASYSDDEDFKVQPEDAGIGSKRTFDDDNASTTLPRRKKFAGDDKLLEQLLGKKAVAARKKSQESARKMTASNQTAPKTLVNRSKHAREQSDEDEEGGRSAAFKSRKTGRGAKSAATSQAQTNEAREVDFHEDPVTESFAEQDATDKDEHAASRQGSISDDVITKQKKSRSYLDEILAQKASKKKRKKHKGDAPS